MWSAEDVDFAQPEAEGVFENPAYSGITPDNFRDAMEFFNYLEGWLKERSEQHLEERFDNGWEYVVNNHRSWISTEDIPLEDPEEADPDELYDHIQEKYDDDIWQTAYTVSRAAQHIIDEVGVTDRVAECENVGEFFYRWATTSRTTFFREIVMEASYKDSPPRIRTGGRQSGRRSSNCTTACQRRSFGKCSVSSGLRCSCPQRWNRLRNSTGRLVSVSASARRTSRIRRNARWWFGRVKRIPRMISGSVTSRFAGTRCSSRERTGSP